MTRPQFRFANAGRGGRIVPVTRNFGSGMARQRRVDPLDDAVEATLGVRQKRLALQYPTSTVRYALSSISDMAAALDGVCYELDYMVQQPPVFPDANAVTAAMSDIKGYLALIDSKADQVKQLVVDVEGKLDEAARSSGVSIDEPGEYDDRPDYGGEQSDSDITKRRSTKASREDDDEGDVELERKQQRWIDGAGKQGFKKLLDQLVELQMTAEEQLDGLDELGEPPDQNAMQELYDDLQSLADDYALAASRIKSVAASIPLD